MSPLTEPQIKVVNIIISYNTCFNVANNMRKWYLYQYDWSMVTTVYDGCSD